MGIECEENANLVTCLILEVIPVMIFVVLQLEYLDGADNGHVVRSKQVVIINSPKIAET